VKLLGKILQNTFWQNYPYKYAAKFTLKNFAFFLIAVQIEAGEMLPHITFPFGILGRFYYLKEII
jgi:hypothetical protein